MHRGNVFERKQVYENNAQSFLCNISEFSGREFLESILWDDMTKRAILFHYVPISFLNSSPLNQKMILSIRFIHPMRNFVFMPITAVFREKFNAWYQTKGNDMVYHLRRAQAWVATQSHKMHQMSLPYVFGALNGNAKIC